MLAYKHITKHILAHVHSSQINVVIGLLYSILCEVSRAMPLILSRMFFECEKQLELLVICPLIYNLTCPTQSGGFYRLKRSTDRVHFCTLAL